MYFFIKLQFVCFITLLLLIAELTLDHFTHSLTLLVVAWQTLYNFLSLFISSVSLALTHNNSRELEQKVNYLRDSCKRSNILQTINATKRLTAIFHIYRALLDGEEQV